MSTVIRSVLFLALLCTTSLLLSQEDHQNHEHPAAGLGSVHFSTSCAAAVAQPLTRAVALLHSFGYEDSRRTFEEVTAADPKCAMAQWGVAMTWYHPIWEPPTPEELAQGSTAIERALAISTGSPREKDFIAALSAFYRDWKSIPHRTRATAYEAAMMRMHERYADDDEVTIFYALSILGNLDQTDVAYVKQKQAAKLLNGILPRNPNHPGVAHYLIHGYDYPALAELALPAARAYAKIAPDAPHALHMPSHIFTRLGLWDDSIKSNIASAKSAQDRVERLHPGTGSSGRLHAADYLVYAYLQQARDSSAKRVLQEMAGLTNLDEQSQQAAYAFAATPQRFALERHDWKASAQLELSPKWFDWSRYPQFEAVAHYGRALGAARAGNATLARSEVATLTDLQKRIPAAQGYDWSKAIAIQREIVESVLSFTEGQKQTALAALRRAADQEDSVDKNAITPGVLLPAREILGELLLESGASADALTAFEASLKIAPHRFNSVAGAARAAMQTGDRAKARAYWVDLARLGEHAESPRPELAQARAFLGTH